MTNSKLTPSRVADIRRRYAAGETQGSIARSLQMSAVQVGRIVRGESWADKGAPWISREPPADPLIITPELQLRLDADAARLHALAESVKKARE